MLTEGHEFRRTEYDTIIAAQEIKRSSYPQAEDFAEENVRKIPTATEATTHFERMAEQRWLHPNA